MSKTLSFLAEEVKTRRKRVNLSQEELSELTGVSMALISEIERGLANPTILSLEKIADYFQVTVAELINVGDALNSAARIKDSIYSDLNDLSIEQLKKLLSVTRAVKSECK